MWDPLNRALEELASFVIIFAVLTFTSEHGHKFHWKGWRHALATKKQPKKSKTAVRSTNDKDKPQITKVGPRKAKKGEVGYGLS